MAQLVSDYFSPPKPGTNHLPPTMRKQLQYSIAEGTVPTVLHTVLLYMYSLVQCPSPQAAITSAAWDKSSVTCETIAKSPGTKSSAIDLRAVQNCTCLFFGLSTSQMHPMRALLSKVATALYSQQLADVRPAGA